MMKLVGSVDLQIKKFIICRMELFLKLDDLMSIINLSKQKKIFAGWNCWLSQITVMLNIDQRQSKRARLIQITKIKEKVSKTGSVSYKINYIDTKTKKSNTRVVKFTKEAKLTIDNFAICITKEKAIAKHDQMLESLEQQYREQLKKALQTIKGFREEY